MCGDEDVPVPPGTEGSAFHVRDLFLASRGRRGSQGLSIDGLLCNFCPSGMFGGRLPLAPTVALQSLESFIQEYRLVDGFQPEANKQRCAKSPKLDDRTSKRRSSNL